MAARARSNSKSVLLSCWKQLLVAELLYKVLAVAVLAPLAVLLFRGILAFSGQSVLADQQILYYFLSPAGWICAMLLGAFWLSILAWEQAHLIGILTAATFKLNPTVKGAAWFAIGHARSVFLAALRIIVQGLLWSAPFLLGLGGVYLVFLTRFDINYYLTEKPIEFWYALILGGLIAIGLMATLTRLGAGWIFVLPLIVFENVVPAEALTESRRRAKGKTRVLALWIAGWIAATLALSAAASGLVGWLGRSVVPAAAESTGWLLMLVGTMLALLGLVNLLVNLISTIAFTTVLAGTYRTYGSPQRFDTDALKGIASGEPHRSPAISGRRLLVGVCSFVVVSGIAGWFALQSVRVTDQTEVTAHRGASASAPENTLAAFKQAILDGADWVELDVQQTVDGQVVVFHDSDFMKLCGQSEKIWEVTREQLREARFDIGSHFDERFSDQRVPTLSDVLDLCRGKVRVNIELKYYGEVPDLEDHLALKVAEIVEQHEMEADVVTMSLKAEAVQQMKSLRPDWKVGLLSAVAAGDLTQTGADFLAVNASMASGGFVRSAHRRGKPVHTWTVNDAASMSLLIGRGVDNLITDRPALALSVLRQREGLGVAERLLLQLAPLFGVEPVFDDQ